ncbi:uncharacterized protein [Macrobrachium rosenbergii]|uniref:uncharacterized protein n=1 Tax=Macrobrachium rosenbergii TaxID=79674 RepID=UPI0034D3E8DC
MIAGLFLSSLISAAIGASLDRNMTYYMLTSEMKKLLPSNTTAVLTSVLWPDFSRSTKVVADVPTHMRCSFEANKARAVAFTYEDDSCSLLGSGGGVVGQVFLYRSVIFPLDGSIEELARGKTTIASAPFAGTCPPQKAVDGSLADDAAYFSASLLKPWWQVDLGEERLIYQIQIFPRQHPSYYGRFHDVEVRVGKTLVSNGTLSSYSLLCSYTKVYQLGEGYLLCSRYNGFIGRYVSIQITAAAAEYLQLNEVNVFALKK